MLPLLLMMLAATSRILSSMEIEMAELGEYEPEQIDPHEIEVNEVPEAEMETEAEEPSESICSCAVRCCSRPGEIRRPSIIFHIPQLTSLYCCGCVDCPAFLFTGQTSMPSAPVPVQQLPHGGETEMAEVEVVGRAPSGAAILEIEPPEIDPIEMDTTR